MSYTRPTDSLVLEGIVTTVAEAPAEAPLADRVNIAPMGPIVEAPGPAGGEIRRLVLRPFTASTTFANLRATGEGVFHVVDDVLLLARAAVATVRPSPEVPIEPAEQVAGVVLRQACGYYEFRVGSVDQTEPRATFVAEVVHHGRLRQFVGFNRARHAVLEAAIAATRVHLLGRDEVLGEIDRLQPLVEKTGGPREHQAMTELRTFVADKPPSEAAGG